LRKVIEHPQLSPPVKFLNWQPRQVDFYSHLNKPWAQHVNYEILGKVFARSLVSSTCAALKIPTPEVTNPSNFRTRRPQLYQGIGRSRLHLSSNVGNTQGYTRVKSGKRMGNYTSKRYVRISPCGYHPNGIQMYVEAYMSGAQRDPGGRDPSDRLYGNYGFPVRENHMGIFVGVSAILHPEKWMGERDPNHDNLMVWAMENSDYTLEAVTEDFEKIRSLIDSIDDDFLGVGLAPRFLREPRYQRVRFRLPDQPLVAKDWSESGLVDACGKLASHFAPVLDEIGREY
jgi:hypothetical protein